MPQVTLPPDMPPNMQKLPRDDVGRPVPFFVEYIDGKPDFRVMNSKSFRACLAKDLCWVCGKRMQPRTQHVFVAGPMCLINLTSAEPPSHFKCAEWSARACPFLVNPKKVRREGNLPEEAIDPGGIMIDRNPGVTALISARYWSPIQAGNGLIIRFRNVYQVDWFCEGREATRDEVAYSIGSGLLTLVRMAQEESPEAERELSRMYVEATKWLPAA